MSLKSMRYALPLLWRCWPSRHRYIQSCRIPYLTTPTKAPGRRHCVHHIWATVDRVRMIRYNKIVYFIVVDMHQLENITILDIPISVFQFFLYFVIFMFSSQTDHKYLVRLLLVVKSLPTTRPFHSTRHIFDGAQAMPNHIIKNNKNFRDSQLVVDVCKKDEI